MLNSFIINKDSGKIAIEICAMIIAVVLHEIAHGFVALKCGDETAKIDGRLSLNPLKHIDLVGLIFIFIFKFGWAKPVPIDPSKFKDRKNGTFFVASAGIIMNMVLAIMSALCFMNLDFIRNNYLLNIFFSAMIQYNVILACFNILPLPPLDGSKMLFAYAPMRVQYNIYKYEKYSYIFIFILFSTGLMNKIIEPMYYSIIKGLIKICKI